jgi:hypothetical protein
MLFKRKGRVGANLLLAGALLTMPTLGAMSLQAHKHAKQKKSAVVIPVYLLALTVKTEHPTYPADSAVKFTLTAKNITHQDVLLSFRSGQRYDFELFRGNSPKGEKIWQWAQSRMFTEMLSCTTLQPGKSLLFAETYKPGGDGMPALTPGVYTVGATLKAVFKSVSTAYLPSAYSTFQVK